MRSWVSIRASTALSESLPRLLGAPGTTHTGCKFHSPYPPTIERSAGPEQAVSRVPQSGQDIPLAVQLTVERGGIDRDLGMSGEHRAHALGSGHQAHEAHVLDPPVPE